MSHRTELDTETAEQAADWFIRVRAADATERVQAEWLRWIEADPTNRKVFMEIQEAWDIVGQVKPSAQVATPPFPSAEDNRTRDRPVSPVNELGRSRTRTALYALAASLVAVLALSLLHAAAVDSLRRGFSGPILSVQNFFSPADSSPRLSTRQGELQRAVLTDGSELELGALTAVKLDFTATSRLIKAEEGEVFYKVAHDSKRPFIVESGRVRVTALGTAFSVRREGDTVSVVVTDGLVDVKSSDAQSTSDIQAGAGQAVRLDHGKLIALAAVTPLGNTGAWQRGRLRFDEEPLSVVVASLNRYAKRQMVLTDPVLRELRFTGTVFNDRAEDWLLAAQRLFPIKIASTDRKVYISKKE